MVPPGADFPLWLSPMRVFHPILWGLVLAAYVFASVTFWLLERQREVSDVLVNTLAAELGAGMRQNLAGPMPVSFLVLWLFYCLQVST